MKIVLVLIASIPFIVSAQETKKSEASKNISLGFSFSPDYSYRTLHNNDGTSSSNFIINIRDGYETGKFGYTTGLSLDFECSKRIGFQTGLLYSNKGYQTTKQDMYYPSPDPSVPVQIKTVYNFHYLDVPFKVNFVTGKNKVKFIAGAGITVNFPLEENEKNILNYSNGDIKKEKHSSTYDYEKLNISSLVSLGVEYKLKENIFLRAEPTFRYGLLKIIDLPVTEYLWNVGLDIGVYYKLK